MKNAILLTLLALCTSSLKAQITDPKATEVWEPKPRAVQPGSANTAPSDAIVLFDGSNLDAWQKAGDGTAAGWKLTDKAMEVVPGAGDIQTRQSFGDCQLHLEFKCPTKTVGDGQNKGNSGVFLQGLYEVQVLDYFDNETYSNGQTASIYKQHIPLVNACLPPDTWQTYDIIYSAPVFNADGVKVRSAYITVLQNGVLVQNHVEIKGTTEYIGLPKNPAHGKGPLKLQDHGNTVQYRNIWIREL
ncbi:MAG: DUF1080 domain-containing protein [Saprospiraceae bacterium]